MLFLRSLAFALGMWLTTLVFAPLAVLTFPLPLSARYRFITLWARINVRSLAIFCGLRYRLLGAENIPPGPAIVFSKHQSAWETLVLQEVFPHQVWILKRELLWVPFFGWGLAMLRPIAIDRKSGRKAVAQLIEQGRRHLDEGRWVIVFPEGTRVAPGETGRYGIGGAALAQATGYPVVPVAHNAGQYWPRRGFLKRPGTVTLVVGPVIETRGKTAEQIREEARDWIERTTRECEATAMADADPSGGLAHERRTGGAGR